jgi:hypothetical protein
LPSVSAVTMRRSAVAFAETRISSGPETSIVGATAPVGTTPTGPVMLTGAGAGVGEAIVFGSTVRVPPTVNSLPYALALVLAFGSER